MEKRPHSDDPDFWEVWCRKDNAGNEIKREIDWRKIANDWQQKEPVTTDRSAQNIIEKHLF
ncbi:MAG: hypothetical protein HPY74_18780 [Firmicutes bacterium]|nr:hypothetical protein [Bacillota bacterium]